MTWLHYSLISLSVFSLYELISRKAGINSRNPRAFSVAYNFLVAMGVPLLLFVEPVAKPELTWQIIIITIFSLFVWTLFSRFEYYAHKYVEASTLSIILKLGPIINFFLAVIILGESITTSKLVSFVLIIIANFLVVGFPSLTKITKDRGLRYALIITFLLGVGWTFDKYLSPIYGAIILTFLNFFVPAIGNLFFPTIKISDIRYEIANGSWKLIILALLSVIGYGSMMKALSLGDSSRVMPITSSTAPIIILFGATFLRERDHLYKKVISGLLIVLAVYLMR